MWKVEENQMKKLWIYCVEEIKLIKIVEIGKCFWYNCTTEIIVLWGITCVWLEKIGGKMEEKINVFDIELNLLTAKKAMRQVMRYMGGESVSTIELIPMEVLWKGQDDA